MKDGIQDENGRTQVHQNIVSCCHDSKESFLSLFWVLESFLRLESLCDFDSLRILSFFESWFLWFLSLFKPFVTLRLQFLWVSLSLYEYWFFWVLNFFDRVLLRWTLNSKVWRLALVSSEFSGHQYYCLHLNKYYNVAVRDSLFTQWWVLSMGIVISPMLREYVFV